MTKGKAILGVLASIAAGTVIGLFLWPNKNSKLLKGSVHQNGINAGKAETKFDELLRIISAKLKHMEATVEGVDKTQG